MLLFKQINTKPPTDSQVGSQSPLIYVCTVTIYFFNVDASPTEPERRVYDVVKSVLDEAQRILQELRSYQGANEEIRQVSKFACYVFICSHQECH